MRFRLPASFLSILFAILLAISAGSSRWPGEAGNGARDLGGLYRAYRAADDSAWKAFNVGDAESVASTAGARRSAASRVLGGLRAWAAEPSPSGPLQPAIEAALLARREGEMELARTALYRLAGMVPPAHEDFGLVQFAAGAAAQDSGDGAAAEAAYQRAGESEAFIARDQAWSRLGDLRAARNDSGGAGDAFRRLLEIQPSSTQAPHGRLWLGEWSLRRGDYDSALAVAQTVAGAASRGEDAARAMLLFARVQRALGRNVAARQSYLNLLSLTGASSIVRAGWTELTDWLVRLGATPTAEEKLAGAQILLRAGEEAGGLALLSEVAAGAAPRNVRVEALEKGAVYQFGRRRWEAARRSYLAMEKMAVGLPDRRADARIGQARCRRNAGEVVEMTRLYRRVGADTTQPVHAARATWELAREFRALGRFAACESVLSVYISRFPLGENAPQATLLRGLCRSLQGRNAAAEEDFRAYQKRAARRAERETGAFWAGRMCLDRGDTLGAIRVLRSGLDYDMPDGYHGYRIRALLGRLSPGDTLVQWRPGPLFDTGEDPLHARVLDEIPFRAGVLCRRGILLARAGFTAEAQTELTQAAALTPDDPTVVETTAEIAGRLGMYSLAMSSARRAMARVDTGAGEARLWRLVYALGHFDLVDRAARASGIDPMLVAGLIRQESLFDPRALSRAGARGLMQLMLPTARAVARGRGEPAPSTEDLYHPDLSVTYGTHYLRAKLAEFGGHVEVALAAYNAGEAKAREWEDLLPAYDPDLYMEMIDYSETKDYVRRVRYNQETFKLFYAPRRAPE